MIEAHGVGVRFLFDRQRRVITSTAARLRRVGSETWGLRDLTFSVRRALRADFQAGATVAPLKT